MNRGKQKLVPASGGYTIVEVLIFLAVSAVMFFMAVIFIGGQQNRAQFTSSVRDFETKLADIANDVATGYYTRPVGFDCRATGSGASRQPSITEPAGDDTFGQNRDCVFAGTVVKFGDPDSGGQEGIMQFAMAGLRTNSGGTSVANIGEANPKPVYRTDASVIKSRVGYGTTVVCVAVGASCTPNAASSPAAIGFFSTFTGSSLTTQGSGIQTDVYLYDAIRFGDTASITSGRLTSTSIQSSALNPGRITICLQSGSTKQYALIRLGSESGSLVITSEVKNYSGSTPSCS